MLFELIGLPYLILFAFVTISAFIETTVTDKLLRFYVFSISALVVVFFIAFRWEIGTDWDNYLSFFASKVSNENSPFDYYFDTGYTLLTEAVAAVSDQYTIFLIVSTILSSGLIFILLFKHTPNPSLGLLVFIGSYLPIHFIGSIRRSIALGLVAIFCFALVRYKEKLKTVPFFILAFLFHKTSIVALPFVSIKSKPYSARHVATLIAVSFLLGTLNISENIMNHAARLVPTEANIGLLVTLGNYAGDTYKEHTPESINPIVQSFLSLAKKYILIYFFYIAIAKKYSQESLKGKLYNIYIIGVIIYSLFIGAPILQTLSVYYLILEVFLSSFAISQLNGFPRMLFFLYIALSSLLSYQSALSVYPELFFPYKSIF